MKRLEDIIDFGEGKFVRDSGLFIDKALSEQINILREDITQIEYLNSNYIIDIGWEPNFEIEGRFIVYLIKDYDWDRPVLRLSPVDLNSLKLSLKKCVSIIHDSSTH